MICKTLNKKNLAGIAMIVLSIFLVSCNKNGSDSGSTNIVPNFRLSLTDAPNGAFDSIKVKIKSVDLLLSNGTKSAIVPLTQGAGVVDLLSLQNGVTMPIGDLQLPKGVRIQEMHFRLSASGHEGVRSNGKKCHLPVSCAGGDVYKIKLDKHMEVGDGEHAHIVLDFNALQSIADDDGESETCKFAPSITIKNAGVWKTITHNDDDFDSKGKDLDNFEVIKKHDKKFGKNKDLDDDKDKRDQERDGHEYSHQENEDQNQCVTALNETPTATSAPTSATTGSATPAAPTPAPVSTPTASAAPIDPTLAPAVPSTTTTPASAPATAPAPTTTTTTPVIVPTAVPNFFGAA